MKRFGAGNFMYADISCYAILLEYCPLGSLSYWLDCVQNLSLIDSLSIARDIASGLEFLHEAKKICNNDLMRVPGPSSHFLS